MQKGIVIQNKKTNLKLHFPTELLSFNQKMGRRYALIYFRKVSNAMKGDYKHSELTERIISLFYKIYNKLGYGFLEKVYENALMIELRKEAIPAGSPISD